MRNSILQYASEEMRFIWSPENRVVAERGIWIKVMQLQSEAGVDISPADIADYVRVEDRVDLERLRELEGITKHDLRARLMHFNELAGHTSAHYGLTSCDVTDNAIQDLVRDSATHLIGRCKEVLSLLRSHIEASADILCVGRTHNQPAQLTTVGKRFATVADELLSCLGRLQTEFRAMSSRGLVGAVGTGMDLARLLDSADKYNDLNLSYAAEMGYNCLAGSVGQVAHRSEDASVAGAALTLTFACANLARMVRLETGYGRMWEIQSEGQVGSSAMPHKRNSITAERINGLTNVAKGYHSMLVSTVGETWLEGDVSDSVTRRVALPGLFCAVDAVLGNTIVLLEKLDLSKELYQEELADCWYEMRSGEVMAEALRRGVNRDQVYQDIRQWQDHLGIEVPGLTSQEVEAILQSDPDISPIRIQIDVVLGVIGHALGEG